MLRALTSRFQLLRSSTFVNTLNLLLCKDTCFHTYTNVAALKRRQRASLTA